MNRTNISLIPDTLDEAIEVNIANRTFECQFCGRLLSQEDIDSGRSIHQECMDEIKKDERDVGIEFGGIIIRSSK